MVDNLADVAAQREAFGCADTDFGDLAGRTLLGLELSGDCAARFRVDLWRSESRREYLVRTTFRDGGCRAWGGGGYYWIALPKLPPGWHVRSAGDVILRDRSADLGASPGQPLIGRLHRREAVGTLLGASGSTCCCSGLGLRLNAHCCPLLFCHDVCLS